MEQQIRFCTSADGTRIAYATYGEGAGTPLLIIPSWSFSQEMDWGRPQGRSMLEHMAQGRPLVTFDRRGVGGSQREVDDFSLEAQVADVAAVVDHVRLERFHLSTSATQLGIVYAARHPERVSRLVLWGPYARGEQSWPAESARNALEVIRADWSSFRRALATRAFPTGPAELQRWYSTLLRESMSPEVTARYVEFEASTDITPYLPQVRAPTLVLSLRGARVRPASAGREVAASIPGARFVALEGDLAILYLDPARSTDMMRQFLDEGEARAPGAEPGEVPAGLLTILFTDIESSTALTQRLGDAKAQELVRAHNAIVREALATHGGTEIKHTGDGIMASFPSASGALECAVAIQRAVEAHNGDVGAHGGAPLQVHIGLNAGEPVAEDEDLFGTAVQLARRICDQAEGGEILVSDVVRQLAAGKGFLFADRGTSALKGFEEPVRLYAVGWREEER